MESDGSAQYVKVCIVSKFELVKDKFLEGVRNVQGGQADDSQVQGVKTSPSTIAFSDSSKSSSLNGHLTRALNSCPTLVQVGFEFLRPLS